MSEELDTENNEGEGIKNLRKQYEATQKELAEARKALDEFNTAKRRETVAGLLKAKGVSPSAASFYSGEDVSEDAVGKWLEDHADVFNYKADTTEEDANTLAASRVNAASSGRVEDVVSTTAGRVIDPVEALRLFESLPKEELVKRGLVLDESQLWGGKKR